MSEVRTEEIGAHWDPGLSDRDILDDHSLQQDRLRGTLMRGRSWRLRPDPGVTRRLIASALLAALAVGIVAIVAFMQKQLEEKKKQELKQNQQYQPRTPSPTARTTRLSPTSTDGINPMPSPSRS